MGNITIIGAGAWGTAIAQILSMHHQVTIWGRDKEKISHYQETRTHLALPNIALSSSLRWTDCIETALAKSDYIIVAIPTQKTRQVLTDFSASINHHIPIIQTAKGIEITTGNLIHQITKDILPHNPIYLLSGPSFAIDLAMSKPTAVTLAGENFTSTVQNIFLNTPLRPYICHDIIGTALGGALKNILAIAAGFCIGHGLGDSAKAALITRGFNEIVKLATKMNAQHKTLYGLSGFGDLMLTANSMTSRNFSYGYALGQQIDIPEQTVEGYYSLIALKEQFTLSQDDYPIFSALIELMNGQKDPRHIILDLLARPFKEES